MPEKVGSYFFFFCKSNLFLDSAIAGIADSGIAQVGSILFISCWTIEAKFSLARQTWKCMVYEKDQKHLRYLHYRIKLLVSWSFSLITIIRVQCNW